MAGKKHKQKGDRVERSLAAALSAAGFPSQRVPLSGAAGGLFKSDLVIQSKVRPLRAEVKARADGWRGIKHWLGDNDLLFLKRDAEAALVVMPWWFFIALLKGEYSGLPEIRERAAEDPPVSDAVGRDSSAG